MISLRQSALELLKQGLTTIEEIATTTMEDKLPASFSRRQPDL